MSNVRMGVIGAGALGFHHVRILRDMPGVAFAGFYEANGDRAVTVTKELGVPAFPAVEGLLDVVDAVTIVVPTPA
ncbi:MAG TPA: Gfo/Idh/MocA family oxidoreductase, partial [Gemmatimonadaceae bacterium]